MTFGEELDRERAQIMRAVRHASNAWAEPIIEVATVPS